MITLADVIRIAYTWHRILSEPPDYYEYIHSQEWQCRAEAAKARAGYRCQVCNGTKRLEAHHRTYENLGHEPPEDITVLCHKCHEIFSKENSK